MAVPLPNIRLKLAGVLVLKEAVVSSPGGHELSFNYTALGGRVARRVKRDPLGAHNDECEHSLSPQ